MKTQIQADARARLRTRRLTGYALAAGAVVGCEQTARADIIYSGVRDEALAPNSFLSLNLNDTGPLADTTSDFLFVQSASDAYRILFMAGLNRGTPFNGEVVDSRGRLSPLGAGAAVGPSQTFGTQFVAANTYTTALLGSSSSGTKFGPFIGAQGKFLGLRFQIPADGSTHYGWARVSVADDLSMTLTDWAYESTADVGIIAGAVPEPASLGLLALGAAGVVALRRGRKSG